MKTDSPKIAWIHGYPSWVLIVLFFLWSLLAEAAIQPSGISGDLSLDGLSDVILMDKNGDGRILLNQGNGELSVSATLYSRSSTLGPLAITDLSGDGYPEILIPYPSGFSLESVWGNAYDQGLSFILNNLSGEITSLSVSHSIPAQVAVGYAGSNPIALIGYENNSLIQTYSIAPPSLTKDLLFIDLNGDAVEELVVLCSSDTGNLVQVYQQQAGVWSEFLLIQLADSTLNRIQAGSLNGDTLPDFLLWSSSADATALLGITEGGFESQPVVLESSSLKKVADLNLDGLLDAVVVTPQQDAVSVQINQGNLQYSSIPVSGISGRVNDIVLGNFTTPATMEFYIWTEEIPDPTSSSGSAIAQNEAGRQWLSLYQVQSGTVSLVTQVALDDSSPLVGTYHNVIIYKNADILAGIYYPYGSFYIPDWTTGASPIENGQITVQREMLVDANLTPGTPVVLGGLDFLANPADYSVYINQYSPSFSEFAFGKPVLPRSLRIDATPPSGIYRHTITAIPDSEPGTTIYYRIDRGAWQNYTPDSTPIIFYQNGTVDFYATLGGVSSAILSREYQIDQSPSTDSDRDDIPDALEENFGLPIYSTSPDYDNDGWNDVDELVRKSDPLDPTSFPSDLDHDGWSDFDEEIRTSDLFDANSKPVALGLTSGEFVLHLNSAIRTTKEDSEGLISEGSLLSVWNVFSQSIASATYQASGWNVRIPGNRPLFFHIREQKSNTVTLIGYSPSYIPCWNPASLYDGYQTTESWLDLVRQRTEQFVRFWNESITPSSLAATLALQYWIIQQSAGNEVLRFGDGVHGDRPEQNEVIKTTYNKVYLQQGRVNLDADQFEEIDQAYDLDAIYEYFRSTLTEDHAWTQLVMDIQEWSRNNAPSQDVDMTLEKILMGLDVPADSFPPTITPDMISQAVASVSAAFAMIPKRETELTGILEQDYENTVLVTADGERWRLLLLANEILPGTQITIRGIVETTCSNSLEKEIRVLEIRSDPPEVAFNNNDMDGDGLSDQWENFYFAYKDAIPSDDSDEDGYTNQDEYLAYTNPRDILSNPSTVPTATPTPVASETPTSTQTPLFPTPTMILTPTLTPTQSVPMIPRPVSVVTYRFSGDMLEEAGFAEVPGGFMGNPAGVSSIGSFPFTDDNTMSDGYGLILECDPGEVQLVMSLPAVQVGSYPILVRCGARATNGSGQMAIAALDGSLDGSLGTLIPSDTKHIENRMKQIAILYYPTSTDTLSVALQLYTPPTSTERVTLYIDNLEVIPFIPGTAIQPDDVNIRHGVSNSDPIPQTEKPMAVQVYECAESSLEEAGLIPIPGGFQPGAIPGFCAMSDIPPNWINSSTDGKGLSFICEPGQTQLVLSNSIAVGNHPVLIRVDARASSEEGNFALAALDGVLDGSISTFIPIHTGNILDGFFKSAILYQPTKSENIVVGVQLYVPSSAAGSVSVFVDRIEVIPFLPGTYLDTSDFTQ